MASAQKPAAEGNAPATTRIPAPAQAFDWSKKVIPKWEGVLFYKKRTVSELTTVSNAIDVMSQEATTLPYSKSKTLFTTQLALVQPLVKEQLATRREEAKQSQKLIDLLKAKSVAPKAQGVQQQVLLQLLQVLNGADAEMKVGDLMERLQNNMISAQDPLPSDKTGVTGAGNTKVCPYGDHVQNES